MIVSGEFALFPRASFTAITSGKVAAPDARKLRNAVGVRRQWRAVVLAVRSAAVPRLQRRRVVGLAGQRWPVVVRPLQQWRAVAPVVVRRLPQRPVVAPAVVPRPRQ